MMSEAEVERLRQHMQINEHKIEEQTREMELLHSALDNLARQRDAAEREIERLRDKLNTATLAARVASEEFRKLEADITWQEERNAMNVKAYSDDNNTLWAALTDMWDQHMPRRLYPPCDCKGCKILRGEK